MALTKSSTLVLTVFAIRHPMPGLWLSECVAGFLLPLKRNKRRAVQDRHCAPQRAIADNEGAQKLSDSVVDVRRTTNSAFKGINAWQVPRSRRYCSEPHCLRAAWARWQVSDGVFVAHDPSPLGGEFILAQAHRQRGNCMVTNSLLRFSDRCAHPSRRVAHFGGCPVP
jgi:hypothetical protein